MTDMPAVLSPAYRLVIRLEIDNRPGMFAEVARTIGARGASLGAIDLDLERCQRFPRGVHGIGESLGAGVGFFDLIEEI